MSNSFDYEFLKTRCQYPVSAPWAPAREEDCGEPAVARAYWIGEDDKEEEMFLCQEHLNFVIKTERENERTIIHQPST